MAEVKVTTVIDSGNSQKTLKDLRREVTEYRNQLVNLERNTEEYNSVLEQQAVVQQQLTNINIDLAQSNRSLSDTFSQASTTLVSGFTAVRGAAALLGGENEALTKTFVQLQAGMALIQSLSRINTRSINNLTVAFRTLGKTILANPIFALSALITVIVTKFGDLASELSFITDLFGELTKSIGGTNSIIDTATQILSGLATSIIRLVTGPLKSLIAAIRGDFRGALRELSNGFNILGNFDDGYTRKATDNSAKRAQAWIEEQRAMRLDSANATNFLIQQNEARLGSDYRYTTEGRELYQQYFNDLLQAYETDSDEYNNALIRKLNYERSYNDNLVRLSRERQDKANAEAKRLADIDKQLTDSYNKSLDRLSEARFKAANEAEKAATVEQERIEFIITEIENNNALIASYEAIINGEYSIERKTDAINNLNEVEQENIRLEQELRRENDNLIAQQKIINELSRERVELELEELKELTDARIEALTLELENEELTNARRIELLTELDEKRNESLKYEQDIAAAEKKLNQQKQKAEDDAYKYTVQILNNSAKILGENTAAGKAVAVAGATIDTYKSATSAYSALAGIPVVGPGLAAAAAAAAITSGIANVKSILSTNIPGVSDNVSSVSTPSIPSIPELTSPIQETHNNMTAFDEEIINQPSRVYVTESDISDTQRKVSVVENKSSF